MRIVRPARALRAVARLTRNGAALLVAIGIAGCVDATIPPASIAGAWSLSAANGAPPPVLLFEAGGESQHLVSMSLTFDRDGSYTSTGVVHSVMAGVDSRTTGTDHGVWTVRGDSVTLRSLQGGVSSLKIDPELLSFFDSGMMMTMSFSRAR